MNNPTKIILFALYFSIPTISFTSANTNPAQQRHAITSKDISTQLEQFRNKSVIYSEGKLVLNESLTSPKSPLKPDLSILSTEKTPLLVLFECNNFPAIVRVFADYRFDEDILKLAKNKLIEQGIIPFDKAQLVQEISFELTTSNLLAEAIQQLQQTIDLLDPERRESMLEFLKIYTTTNLATQS